MKEALRAAISEAGRDADEPRSLIVPAEIGWRNTLLRRIGRRAAWLRRELLRPRGTPAMTWMVRGTGVIGLIGLALIVALPETAPLIALGIVSLWLNGPLSMFFPTTLEPIVMLFGRVYEPLLVAAAATAGNIYVEFLNYHLYRKLLGLEKMRSFRETRVVRLAIRLFRQMPFFTTWLCAWSVLPFWVIRFVAPMTDYPLSRYMTATLLGRFPKMWLFAALGVWLGLSADVLLPVTLAFILLSVSIALVRRLHGRAERAGEATVAPPLATKPPRPIAPSRPPVPIGTSAAATGTIELLVDAPEFFERLAEDLAAARSRAWLQASTFEGDTAGRSVADALLASPATDRRVIVDYYTRHFLSDRFLFTPRNLLDADLRAERRSTSEMFEKLKREGVGVRFVNPAGLFFLRMPAREHKKIVVVDEEIAYLGGINFSDHNFAWHDLMLRIKHPGVAGFLASDLDATWRGVSSAPRARFDGVDLFSVDGSSNEVTLEPILDLIREARRSVIVHSAYITFPFTGALRAAQRRGARVTVLTPEANNRGVLRSYILRERERSGFELRFLKGRMSHLKAILVDDRRLITGSANFDWLAYRYHGEIIAVLSQPDVIDEFRTRVLVPDLAASRLAPRLGSRRSGKRAECVLRCMSRASRLLCVRSSRPVLDAR